MTNNMAPPTLGQETLYVGVDIGKTTHVAGYISATLLARHQRFEHCPALTFANSREGFRSLVDRIQSYVPLTQVYVVLEITGHYHRALQQYLQELDVPVYAIHVQKRQGACSSPTSAGHLPWPNLARAWTMFTSRHEARGS